MKNFIINHYEQNKNDTIYIALTVRPIKSYIKTKRWLKKNLEFRVYTCLASNQSIKVSLVKRLVKVSKHTLFVDDFTYGIDKVKYYVTDLIDIRRFEAGTHNFVFIEPDTINSHV
jgi:hypothetical protein